MDPLVAGIIGAVVGAICAEGARWVFNQFRRSYSFAITSAQVIHRPVSNPTSTTLVVALDSSNTEAKPTITSVAILDRDYHTHREEYTLVGTDAAKVSAGDVTLGDLGNQTLVFEVCSRGTSGYFDLDRLVVEVKAGASARQFGLITTYSGG
jgi:hypothetical protein